ncbi:diguanylate cyclase [bacterium]|nr:diguanylate cyclase [candidate division CSSED10-310 bacterium]
MMGMRSDSFSFDELHRMAITDELTGLYNRRYLKFRLNEELERARRSDREAALLLLDVDGLKSVNDIYGHPRGDRLLVNFSEVLISQVRSFDLVARYAGDEFVILLPECGKEKAVVIAERIRTAVAEKMFTGDPDLKVTTCVGVAVFPMDGLDAESLLKAADNGLYAAKRLGRNQVANASEETSLEEHRKALLVPRMVGRDEEMFLLGRHLTDTIQGHGGIVLVMGELGVGRSRLLGEFRTRAVQVGAVTLFETCYEHSRFIPHQPIRGALRQFFDTDPRKSYQNMMGLNQSQRQEMLRLLPELDPARLAISDAPRATSDEEFQLFDAVTQYVLLLARKEVVVLIIDDLQWMDEATTRFLIYMVRATRNQRIMFLGSYLSGDPGDSGTGKQAFKTWQKGFREISEVSIIELHRFNRARTRELVHTLLGQAFPLEFTDLVHRESEGNPFYVEEILKALIEQEVLNWTPGGWDVRQIKQLTAPDSIREMIFSQLDRLEAEDRKLLSMAGVMGRIFNFDVMQMVSGLNEGHLLDILERLENLQLIHQLPSQKGERYQFTHNKIREVLYEQMDGRRRSQAHLRVAEALERIYRGKTELIAEELAHHYIEGRMIERAVLLYRQAGDKAGSLHAENSAMRYYKRAIRLIEHDTGQYSQELSALHQKVALILKEQGRGMQAIDKFRLAVRIGSSFMTPFRKAQIHRWIAQIYIDSGRFEAAAGDIRMAENFLDPEQDKVEFLRLETCKAALMLQRGEFEACLELTRKYADDLKDTQYWVERSDIYDLMATAEFNLGNRDLAVRMYSDSLELRRKARDLSRISRSYTNLAGIFMEAGRWDDALHWYNKCIRIEETLGHVASLAHPNAMVAQLLMWKNQLNEAEKYCRQSIQIRELSDDIPGLAVSQTILMHIHIQKGEMERARKVLMKAEQLHSDHDIGLAGQKVVMARAYFEMKQGNLDTAITVAEDILRIARLFGDPSGKAESHVLMGKIEKARGNFDAAMEHLSEAERINLEIKNRFELARCLKEKGLIARARGDDLTGYRQLTAARDIFSEIGCDSAEREIRIMLEPAN